MPSSWPPQGTLLTESTSGQERFPPRRGSELSLKFLSEAALAAATESGPLLSKQLPNLKHWEGFGLQSQHYSDSLIILDALNPVWVL